MDFLGYVDREAAMVFTSEFAEAAPVTPAGSAAREVRGIFDRVSELSDIGEIIESDGVAASFNVYSSSVSDVARGDAVSIRGYDYRVVGIEPDGTGRTVLVLGI